MVELRPTHGAVLEYSFAGDAFNTAVYLKRTAPDLRVSFLSATGDEELSEELRLALKKENLGDEWLFRIPNSKPALYLIRVRDGDRHFTYWRSDSPAKLWLRELLAVGPKLLDEADLVYLSGISLAILRPDERHTALDMLSATRARIAYDPNVRLTLWNTLDDARECLETIARFAAFLLPSRQDLEMLYGLTDPSQQIQQLAGMGEAEIALTCDLEGCRLWSEAREFTVGSHLVSAIDPSGAGDAFNGAYLASRLLGSLPQTAATVAQRLASRVVQFRGAIIAPEDMWTEAL